MHWCNLLSAPHLPPESPALQKQTGTAGQAGARAIGYGTATPASGYWWHYRGRLGAQMVRLMGRASPPASHLTGKGLRPSSHPIATCKPGDTEGVPSWFSRASLPGKRAEVWKKEEPSHPIRLALATACQASGRRRAGRCVTSVSAIARQPTGKASRRHRRLCPARHP